MRKSTNHQLVATTMFLLWGVGLIASVNAQDAQLTAESAMGMMKSDVGKWSGVQTTYLSNGETGQEKVVIINRIEANAWLYFQIAEKTGSETSLTKGTLEFDTRKGQFVRRWFENGNPEIKSATAKFNPESKTISFSMMVPSPTPVPDDDFGLSDLAKEETGVWATTELSSPDEDSRLIRVYNQPDLEKESDRKLVSELKLTRYKPPTKNSTAKAPGASKAQPVASAKKAAPTEPVTHTLRVTVFVGSARLETGQEPELEITPDDDVQMKRVSGDTFEFTGLKPGEEYAVTGKFKLTTGFGVETKGKTTAWKIAEDSTRSSTATKVLKLQ